MDLEIDAGTGAALFGKVSSPRATALYGAGRAWAVMS